MISLCPPTLRRLLYALLLFATLPTLAAETVRAINGNLHVIEASGAQRKLTFAGADTEPVLSPDGRWVTFLRTKANSDKNAVHAENEIWLIDIAGRTPRRLLEAKPGDEAETTLSRFHGLNFSNDGKTLYFLSRAWVTSAALHALDLANGQHRFITGANSVDVVRNGLHAGALVVQKHKYFTGRQGGSYDYFWLISPEGDEIAMVGKTQQSLAAWYKKQAHQTLPVKTVSRP